MRKTQTDTNGGDSRQTIKPTNLIHASQSFAIKQNAIFVFLRYELIRKLNANSRGVGKFARSNTGNKVNPSTRGLSIRPSLSCLQFILLRELSLHLQKNRGICTAEIPIPSRNSPREVSVAAISIREMSVNEWTLDCSGIFLIIRPCLPPLARNAGRNSLNSICGSFVGALVLCTFFLRNQTKCEWKFFASAFGNVFRFRLRLRLPPRASVFALALLSVGIEINSRRNCLSINFLRRLDQ